MKGVYPNLMCFGNEPDKCGYQELCPDYNACKERYCEVWFSFMEKKTARNCRFAEEYPGLNGEVVIGCAEDNIWCNDCIAAKCERYVRKV